MPRFTDLTGKKFGKLQVIEMIHMPNRTGIYWKCICDCGSESKVRTSSLINGRTKSCGCAINQSNILKFKKENQDASYEDFVKERIKAHTKWVGECLEWTATTSNGYGVFVYKGKTINASRAAWIVAHGELPKGICVLHHCDNRRCCRLSHLFPSTHKVNTQDMIKKGRDNWQTCRKFPIGTREKVWELRQSGKMYREICTELNLTMDQVKSLLQNHKNKLKRDRN